MNKRTPIILSITFSFCLVWALYWCDTFIQVVNSYVYFNPYAHIMHYVGFVVLLSLSAFTFLRGTVYILMKYVHIRKPTLPESQRQKLLREYEEETYEPA